MQNFIDLRLKPHVLEQLCLPDIAYPIPSVEVLSTADGDGQLPFAIMLYCLQQRSHAIKADWRQIEAGMARLIELLTPDDDREVIIAAGDNWWLEIGPTNLNGELVTVQRDNALIAAISTREDGRLRVATFRPLDAHSVEYLIGLSQNPHPDGRVCMRENNWEYALDCSAGMGNNYNDLNGLAYLSYWENGIGISSDGTDVPDWRCQKNLPARRPALVAMELGVHYTMQPDH